jgi:hypothetical protein
MVDPNPIRRTDAGALGAASAAQPGAASSASKPSSGPAFRALMEKLAEQAKTLQRESESVANTDQLSGAVDLAGDTLRTALSVRDEVLEAFRQAQQGRDPSEAA